MKDSFSQLSPSPPTTCVIVPPNVLICTIAVPVGAAFVLEVGVIVKEKLNIRQRKFAEYYAQSGNTVQSAIKAGYSENYANANACKLLENVRVSEYIREITDKLKDERILTAKDRQVMLSDIAKDKNNEPGDRIRAVDTLNRMTGEYTVKVDTTVGTSEKLSDVFRQLGGEGLEK